MLSPQEIDDYVGSLTADQAASVRFIRTLLLETSPDLIEKVDDGKWFRGLLTYDTPDGIFAYALGPLSGGLTTFHMMPFYGCKELRDLHGAALKPFISGKSCIRFRNAEQLPQDSLRDIVGRTDAYAQIAKQIMDSRKAACRR
jgi:hypothetical protein